MTKEEEIRDSIEFCNDIYIYLEPQKNRISEPEFLKNRNFYQNVITEEKMLEKAECSPDDQGIFSKERIFFFVCLLAVVICARLVTVFLFQVSTVHGDSMETTFQDGNMILTNKISCELNHLKRYDIIVFKNDSDSNLIKRIIGLPGETVLVQKGKIYINGKELIENYGCEPMDPTKDMVCVKLEQDEYFVMGDNRNVSLDSRYESVGPVKSSKILGKAWIRFYPFNQWKIF